MANLLSVDVDSMALCPRESKWLSVPLFSTREGMDRPAACLELLIAATGCVRTSGNCDQQYNRIRIV